MVVASRRQREREHRRASILDAARQVFRERGVAAATMEEVATAAELSKGTLYLYFRSKDELFMALASEVIEKALAAFAELSVDTSITGLEQFRRLVQKWCEVAVAHPHTVRNMFVWLALGEEIDTTTEGFRDHRSRVERVHEYMVAAIELGKRDGSIRGDVNPFELTAQIWGCLMGTIVLTINAAELRRRLPNKTLDEKTLVPSAIDLLFAGLASGTEP